VAGRGVNNRPRIVVVAHELGVGVLELHDQAIENFRQRFVRSGELVVQFLRDRRACHDVVARFADDGFESVNGRLQRSQFCRRHAIAAETGNVRVGEVVDVLAILDGIRVPLAGQV